MRTLTVSRSSRQLLATLALLSLIAAPVIDVSITLSDSGDPFDGVPRVVRSDRPESEDVRLARRLERKEMRTWAEERGATPEMLGLLDEVIEARSQWDAEGLPW